MFTSTAGELGTIISRLNEFSMQCCKTAYRAADNIIFFCLWAEFFLDKLSAKILSWRLSHPPIKYVSPRFYVEIKSQWPFSSFFKKKIKKSLIFFFLRPNLSAKIQLSPTFLRAPLACSAFYYPLGPRCMKSFVGVRRLLKSAGHKDKWFRITFML